MAYVMMVHVFQRFAQALRLILKTFYSSSSLSYSKPLPPFTFDVLCYLNQDQLERFSIISYDLKNVIDRYFQTKPYRVFDCLYIRGGSYDLCHLNSVQWNPNREDYSVQQFLAAQKCGRDWRAGTPWNGYTYHSFGKMRPYLGPTVRIKETFILVAGDSTFNPEHIAEMESIAYLWRDCKIGILNARHDYTRIVANDFQLILNSPTILQCQTLLLDNAYFSFKDYKVLYTVNVIELRYYRRYYEDKIDLFAQHWQQFLEQPGVKPVVVFIYLLWPDNIGSNKNADDLLDRLSKAFSTADLPNSFKILFVQGHKSLTEFQGKNSTSREILELKKGPAEEYQALYPEKYQTYTLERRTCN